VDNCFIGIFNGKISGKMEKAMYKAIMDMDDLNRSGKQIYVANYLLCNKKPKELSVLDDIVEMVIEYFSIFNTLVERVEEVVKEIEFDDYEPPVSRASREKTYKFTVWLLIFFEKMVI
jgi:tyrosine-protein phosphatase YwqE